MFLDTSKVLEYNQVYCPHLIRIVAVHLHEYFITKRNYSCNKTVHRDRSEFDQAKECYILFANTSIMIILTDPLNKCQFSFALSIFATIFRFVIK